MSSQPRQATENSNSFCNCVDDLVSLFFIHRTVTDQPKMINLLFELSKVERFKEREIGRDI